MVTIMGRYFSRDRGEETEAQKLRNSVDIRNPGLHKDLNFFFSAGERLQVGRDKLKYSLGVWEPTIDQNAQIAHPKKPGIKGRRKP